MIKTVPRARNLRWFKMLQSATARQEASSRIEALVADLRDTIRRAGKYLVRLNATSPSATPAGFRSAWPDYADQWAAYGAEPETMRPIPLNAEQVRVLENVDHWINRYVDASRSYRRRRAIWLYALNAKPKLAAQRLNCSRQTYRLDVQSAINDILAGLVATR